MAQEFDTRQLPSRRGIGLRPGSSAQRTERFQRGITQGARFQHTLRQQAADKAFRESQLETSIAEAEKTRQFRAGESALGRKSQEKIAAWRTGLGARGQDAQSKRDQLRALGGTTGSRTGTTGSRTSGGGIGLGKIDEDLVKHLNRNITELQDTLATDPDLQGKLKGDALTRKNNILSLLTQRKARINTLQSEARKRGEAAATPNLRATFDKPEPKAEDKKPKTRPRLKRGEIRLSEGGTRKKGDLSAFAGVEGKVGEKNNVRGMWFGSDFVGEKELTAAGYEVPEGADFVTRSGEAMSPIGATEPVHQRRATLRKIQPSVEVAPAPAPPVAQAPAPAPAPTPSLRAPEPQVRVESNLNSLLGGASASIGPDTGGLPEGVTPQEFNAGYKTFFYQYPGASKSDYIKFLQDTARKPPVVETEVEISPEEFKAGYKKFFYQRPGASEADYMQYLRENPEAR
jgi:hypothetical protein